MKFSFCKKQYVYMGLAALALSLALVSHVSAQERELPVRLQDRILNLSSNMGSKMESAILRFEQILVRVESRIQKLSAAGRDTSSASSVVALAQSELDEAKEALAEAKAGVRPAVTSDDPRREWQKVGALFLVAAQSIRDTRVHLQTVLSVLLDETAQQENPEQL